MNAVAAGQGSKQTNLNRFGLSENGVKNMHALMWSMTHQLEAQVTPLLLLASNQVSYQPKNTILGKMNSKQFQRFLDRDGSCIHCGTTEALAPHHRANRGSGGSKLRDVPSNIVVMCSEFNGAMESSATLAKLAKDAGWKLTQGQKPEETPVLYGDGWYLLDDKFGRVKLEYETPAIVEP